MKYIKYYNFKIINGNFCFSIYIDEEELTTSIACNRMNIFVNFLEWFFSLSFICSRFNIIELENDIADKINSDKNFEICKKNITDFPDILQCMLISKDKVEIIFHPTFSIKSRILFIEQLAEIGIHDRDANRSAFSFYSKFGGDQILNTANYPAELNDFLQAELSFFDEFVIKKNGRYTALFEVGCGKARNMHFALNHKLYYYGIDFVADDIEQAKKIISKNNLQSRAHVSCMSVFDFNIGNNIINKLHTPLCIFPFNSLGNMGNTLLILKEFYKCGYDILVTSYRIDEYAIGVRRSYFEKCGYRELKFSQDESGITFTSEEGLKSVAFDPDYFLALCASVDYRVKHTMIGEIGIVYTLRHPWHKKNSKYFFCDEPKELQSSNTTILYSRYSTQSLQNFSSFMLVEDEGANIIRIFFKKELLVTGEMHSDAKLLNSFEHIINLFKIYGYMTKEPTLINSNIEQGFYEGVCLKFNSQELAYCEEEKSSSILLENRVTLYNCFIEFSSNSQSNDIIPLIQHLQMWGIAKHEQKIPNKLNLSRLDRG